MNDLREKFMQIDRRGMDRAMLELLDMMVWRLEEYDNRLRGLDRMMNDVIIGQGKGY